MINNFSNEHRFLSNFYPSKIKFDGIEYPSIEHAFQAAKTLDYDKRLEISKLKYPRQAKASGRKLKLRKNWEHIKISIMYTLVMSKFHEDPNLTRKLLATGNKELVEGNTWGDDYWGMCSDNGLNMLGKILMVIRSKLS